jgi:hypothetical protein
MLAWPRSFHFASRHFLLHLNTEESVVITDQERKAEVLKFSDSLRAAGVARVTVSYYGDGDEGRAEPPQFQDATESPIEESLLPTDVNIHTLGDLLEGFAPEGYEDNEGGFGTVTFDVQALTIRVEHNWNEVVSHPDAPREI